MSERKIGEELRAKNRELAGKIRPVVWNKNSFILELITNIPFVLIVVLKTNTKKHLEDLVKDRDSWKSRCLQIWKCIATVLDLISLELPEDQPHAQSLGPVVLGAIKWDTQIKGIKITKRNKANAQTSRCSGTSSVSPDPLASATGSVSPDPLASDAGSVSPDPTPWAQAEKPPRLSLCLGARLLKHGGHTSDVTRAMPPMLQQGMTATIPTTPVTVEPYLFHREVPPHSKRKYGKN